MHRIFLDAAVVSQQILSKYKQLFPEYTDHSQLHSLTVIDSCNKLIGRGQIEKMNKDEVFILLMACYLHDVGMGIGDDDYNEFKDIMGEKEYFEAHPDDSKADFVRTYHNEFSALFVEKYAELFEIPSKEHVYAIKQVVRGHRKTDLYDDSQYPANYEMPNGNRVCLPYLASLIRLADEIDVAASRNPMILFDMDLLSNEISILENKKLMAVESVKMTKSSFILYTRTDSEFVIDALRKMRNKMQDTLDICRDVVSKRSSFVITQKKVILEQLHNED